MYIIIDEKNYIVSGPGIDYFSTSQILIQSWPEVSIGKPYTKLYCKWNGSFIVLKSTQEIDIEKASKSYFSSEQTNELKKIIDDKIKV